MSKVLVLCFENVEEVECLTVVDFCRRAGIDVVTAKVAESAGAGGNKIGMSPGAGRNNDYSKLSDTGAGENASGLPGACDGNIAGSPADRIVNSSHGVSFLADALLKDVDAGSFDAIVYPGGPGSWDIGKIPGIKELAAEFVKSGKLLAAICASPGMLSSIGILKGRTATGYPGCNPEGAACWTENLTERDGNIITGKGPGAAAAFAVEIIRYLEGEAKALEIRSQTMMPPNR